jgi:AraC-like DNA-binding protein
MVGEPGFERFGAIPSAAGTLSRYASAQARVAGIDVAPLMAKAGVTHQQAEDDNVRITVPGQIRFVQLVADALQDDLLGFHLAESFDLREAGLVYYVPASSESLGDALRNLARYSTIGNEGVALSVREGENLVVTFQYIGVERRSDRHQIESFLTVLVRLCRQLTNRSLLPNRVRLCHRRIEGCSELEKFLGCDVVFGADTDEVSFSGTAKELPVVTADTYLNKLLIKHAEAARSYRKSTGGKFRVDLENAISVLLPHGKARLPEIARRFNVSPSTLARRLASEGLTFAQIREELKLGLAVVYLQEADLPISEIAWLLGYQEVSAFTHAFKRWTGKTPRETRVQKKAARDGRPGQGPPLIDVIKPVRQIRPARRRAVGAAGRRRRRS